MCAKHGQVDIQYARLTNTGYLLHCRKKQDKYSSIPQDLFPFRPLFLRVFQELDLSNNYLDNLPAGLFRDMSNLTKLTLHNNSLTVMDRELFQVDTADYATPIPPAQHRIRLATKMQPAIALGETLQPEFGSRASLSGCTWLGISPCC